MIFADYLEWDEAKEASNLVKHGVSFVEAVAHLRIRSESSCRTRITAS